MTIRLSHFLFSLLILLPCFSARAAAPPSSPVLCPVSGKTAQNSRLIALIFLTKIGEGEGIRTLCRDHKRDYFLFATCTAWIGA